jgi:hypothetical protein
MQFTVQAICRLVPRSRSRYKNDSIFGNGVRAADFWNNVRQSAFWQSLQEKFQDLLNFAYFLEAFLTKDPMQSGLLRKHIVSKLLLYRFSPLTG